MTLVNTVRGELSPEDLGRTLMHEHFQFGYPGVDGDRTMWSYDEEAVVATGAKVIGLARGAQFSTVIDATPNDCQRNPEVLRRIAQENDFNIICSTGFYYEAEGAPAYFKFRSLFADITTEISELMQKELTEGIADTGIKAGVIKVGTSKDVITDYEACLLKAAARAQQATGAPIITHTQAGTMGPDQAKILVDAGADPSKVVIGHMCGNVTDLDYQVDTLRYGVGIGYDRIGLNKMFNEITDDDRMDGIAALLERGYGDRVYLSHDSVNHWLGRDASGFHELPGTADWSISRIGDYIVPGLLERGCSTRDIDGLLIDNVANLWADGPGGSR
ncbi:phosphotriesterase family protein [Streptomyces sp. YIM S03343]